MALYKVGDVVEIVEKRTQGFNGAGLMDKWLGRTMTITIDDWSWRYPYKMREDGGYWDWNDGMIAGLASELDFDPASEEELAELLFGGD